MHLVEIHLFEEFYGLLEFRLGLAGEAYDHVCRDGGLLVIAPKEFHALHKLFRRIVAVHPAQRRVAAALQGQMEVGAHFRHVRDPLDKLFCHDPGLQRAQADPLNARNFPDLLHEVQKEGAGLKRVKRHVIRPRVPLQTIGTDVDTGEDHLPDPFSCYCADFFQDLAGSPAADPSSRVRNNAVRAELIASVLYFDKGPGVARVLQLHVLVLRAVCQVRHRPAAECAAVAAALTDALQELIQQLRDPGFVVIADRQIDGRIGPDPLGIGLHVASDCDDDRVGIAFFGLMDHLAALSVRDVGDRAGIDHVYVRLLFKGDDTVTGFLHFLTHYVQFIAVDFASEVVKCGTFQSFFPLLIYEQRH